MQATSLALDHLLRAVGDPVGDLAEIGRDHPEFRQAQIIRAAAGVVTKTQDALPAIAQAIRTTDADAGSPRTRAHLAAAEAWLCGNPVLAAERYATIVNRWPSDLLALRLAQSCYFFLGWHDRLRALVDSVMPAWRRDQPGFQFVLAIASYAYAETGDAAHAEILGREALASDPACPVAVHAVAHALAASGRHRSGAQWMRARRAQWVGPSRMLTHNAWHLAMFDAEAGDVAPALAVLDALLIPAGASSSLDACDAAALLWRLTQGGIDDAGRWARLSDAFERTVTPGFWPYVDLYAALAHLSAGNRARAQRLEQHIQHCAQGGTFAALRARHITLPGLRALCAWADGCYDDAARLLAGLRPFLAAAGGSHMQLEVFKSVEREAVRRRRASQCDQPGPSSAQEQTMPLINVKLIEGVFSEAQRKQIAKSLTDAMVQIEGEAMRSVTWCVVEEVKSGDWAIGGQPLTAADVKAIAAPRVA